MGKKGNFKVLWKILKLRDNAPQHFPSCNPFYGLNNLFILQRTFHVIFCHHHCCYHFSLSLVLLVNRNENYYNVVADKRFKMWKAKNNIKKRRKMRITIRAELNKSHFLVCSTSDKSVVLGNLEADQKVINCSFVVTFFLILKVTQ